MKKVLFVIFAILAVTLAACGGDDSSKALSEERLVVGSMSGQQEGILEAAAKVAAKDGLEIEIVSFSDYVLPNTALDEGDLDANIYQHTPFLEQFNKDRDTELTAVGEAFLNPMAIFSEKYDSIEEVEDAATFGLPNDPTNSARALFMLQEVGLIKLDEETQNPSVLDITENSKNIEFKELEAAQLPKLLDEVDFAAINSNYAFESGLHPVDDSIYRENTNSPYIVHVVVRDENKDDPVVQKLVDAYQSEEVKAYIEENFEGTLLPGWEQ